MSDTTCVQLHQRPITTASTLALPCFAHILITICQLWKHGDDENKRRLSEKRTGHTPAAADGEGIELSTVLHKNYLCPMDMILIVKHPNFTHISHIYLTFC